MQGEQSAYFGGRQYFYEKENDTRKLICYQIWQYLINRAQFGVLWNLQEILILILLSRHIEKLE